MNKSLRFLAILLISISPLLSKAQTPDANHIVYVTPNGTGDGSSWTNATSNLQGAINASGVFRVYVAVGNYNAPVNSFVMKSYVSVYGGFDPANNITDITNRIMPNPANLYGSVLNGSNARTVVKYTAVTAAVLDGFTITGGNSSSYDAGGINIDASDAFLNNLVIKDNMAGRGGGIKISNNTTSFTRLINSIITRNTTTASAGGIWVYTAGRLHCTNVTIANNTSGTYKAFEVDINASITLENSIVFGGNNSLGTITRNYSFVEGKNDTNNGNISSSGIGISDVFVNPSANNYALKENSPARNKGSNSFFWFMDVNNAKDLAGNRRFVETTIDMGAYERQIIIPTPDANNILYVNANVSGGTETGSSWANAIPQLADALKWARQQNNFTSSNPLKIYVGKGTYKPLCDATDGNYTTNGNRNNAFVMVNNVQIYGGFDPDNNIKTMNDARLLPSSGGAGGGTILSGDIGTANDNTDNTYHVVIASGNMGTALLDGFTITDGNANGGSNTTVNGSNLSENHGAGIYNFSSSPLYRNLVIKNNRVEWDGAGMMNDSSSPIISNVLFTGNYVQYKGTIANYNNSLPVLANVTITGNTSDYYSGIFNSGSTSYIYNSIIWDNKVNGSSTASGTDIFNDGTGYATVKNSITQSYTTGNAADNNLVGTTPLFTDAANANYTLQNTSLAIGKGNNQLYWDAVGEGAPLPSSGGVGGGLGLDLSGNKRLVNSSIDIGAYENQTLQTEPDANNILYVNLSATGDGSGNTWANAIPQLADALKWARQQNNFTSGNPLKIYVSKGTYKPMYNAASNALTSATDRDNSFVMVNNVQIYGGFDPATGIDDLTDTRIFGSDGSILSGDIGTVGTATDNTYHVVISSGVVGTARLDGFTVTAAYNVAANTVFVTVNSNSIYRNYGGAMQNYNSSPAIANCSFIANTAYDGGGMYNTTSSSPSITNCNFSANTAVYGGGMYNYASSPSVINCTFTTNTASSSGGGMYNNASSPVITNCHFTANTVSFGGGIFNTSFSAPKLTNTTIANNGSRGFCTDGSGTPVLQNTIVWDAIIGSYTATYSLIKDKTDATNDNINATGLAATDIFKDYANGDYTLKSYSPAINKGSNQLYWDAVNGGVAPPSSGGAGGGSGLDLAGNPRVYRYADGGIIDIGAYEYQSTDIIPGTNNILYVNANVSGSLGTGTTWENAIPQLADALKWARQQNNFTSGNPLKIYVAKGTYKPMYNAESNAFTSATDRDNAFVIVSNVQLYGGFDPATGINALTDNRLLPSSSGGDGGGSILSGNIGAANDNTDNAYHVVISSNSLGLVFDGFIVTGAYSVEADKASTIVVNGNYVKKAYGGGMYNYIGSPTIVNCSFTANTAYYGGGMYNISISASSAIVNCSFIANTAIYAGGMYNTVTSLPAITNCRFTGNTSMSYGGAIYSLGSHTITNTTIANNGSYGIYSSSNILVQNCIIWDVITGSYTAKNSLIKGANPSGTGNIDATNLAAADIFTNYSDANYTLKNGSPIIAKGDNTLFTGLTATTLDMAGNPRVYNYANGGIIDIGAYEFQGLLSQTINFAALDPKTTTSADFALTATASSSLAVSYTSSNTAVAEVYQDAGVWKVKIKGEGNTNITATQTGDGNYAAATAVAQQLIVVGAPLPVTLTSYTAKAEGNHVKLQWQTTQEVNNKGFEIYRSGDDKQWLKIGDVQANDNSIYVRANYYSTLTYTDKQPLNGTNYYKLVQIDNDGKPTELGVRTVTFNLQPSTFNLYPNPTANQTTVNFTVGHFTQLQVADVTGKVLQQFSIDPTESNKILSLGQYPVGIYIIHLKGKSASEIKKVARK